jgi:hypothetical protein
MAVEASVRTLRAFLKDEREAAVRYRRALPRFTDRAKTDELNACLASHERRIATLEGWIRRMGAETGDGDEDEDDHEDEDGGDAIRALEESEDRSLKHYLDDVGKLDGDTRRLVAREILPEQVRTYDWVNDLRLTRLD